MDANAKLGLEIIKEDPNFISENGVLLFDIIRRQNLQVLNADINCTGVVTRHRKTVIGDQKAVLDYILVCDQLAKYFSQMFIDEGRHHVLSKYATTKGVRKKV